MYPTLGDICIRTRIHLNDANDATYHDEKLIGYISEAQEELEDALAENGIQVLEEVSITLDVPANTTRISYPIVPVPIPPIPTLPIDLVDVLYVEEKVFGSTDDRFVPVLKTLVLPVVKQYARLVYYTWREQALEFIGSTVDTQIRLRYIKGFPNLNLPVDKTQTIPFNRALPFLAAKTAALIAANVMKDYDRASILQDQAQMHLGRALNRNVRNQQDTPVRRIGWSRRAGRRRFTIDRTRP